MRIILLFSIVLLVYEITQAQIVSDGLYVNEESKEFVYINNDSIQFRLSNKDAFGSFSIAKGYFEYKGGDKYYIQSEHIGEESSVINVIARKDSLISVKVLYKDNTPIMFASVYFKEVNKSEKDFEFVCLSDAEGGIVLNENQVGELHNKELLLQVEALGFSTAKNVVLKQGYEYVVQSAISDEYPFTLFKTGKILMNEINIKEIEVEIWRKKSVRNRYGTTKLLKVDTTEIPLDFLD
ncbi:MAG: hypothetical protein IPL35_17755 [Sphingobacteriales bacterium]|nr:hypothetical protein [Sphingobacteriales bacterium]